MTIKAENKGYLNCPRCQLSYNIDMRKNYNKCFVCYCPVRPMGSEQQ